MHIGLIITNRVPVNLPDGMIFASIPIHIDIALRLAQKGHKVTVFCSEDSQLPAGLHKKSFGLQSAHSLKSIPGKVVSAKYDSASVQLHYAKSYEYAEKNCDLVWSHDAAQLANYAPFVTIPTVFTLHDPLDRDEYSVLPHYTQYQNHYFVSISNAQRQPMPNLPYAETIYHGMDITHLPFEAEPQGYAVFFGRIIKEKGVLESITVAKRANLPLKIIGPLGSETPARLAYSDEVMAQVDGKSVEYLGGLSHDELLPIVARAKVFINMVNVRESFGMVLIESMATGTPVVARNRGSVAEVLENGETGFVVETEDEAVEALKNIDTIDRKNCRKRVQEYFSIDRCADDYEQLFQKILSK